MALISAAGRAAPLASSAGAVRGGSTGFSVPMSAAEPVLQARMTGTGMATAISGSMLLALQQQPDREGTDESGRRNGRQMLDELARLQRALLSDEDDASLRELEELARNEPGDVDPALGSVLSSIRLRARIELARRVPRSDTPTDSF